MEKDIIRENAVSLKHAASHAMTQLHLGVLTKAEGIAGWRGANLGQPIIIYDLNGEPLFYDFPVHNNERKQLGQIRTSASRINGVPVQSIQMGSFPVNLKEATYKAAEVVSHRQKRKIIGTKLVCYAYPKLGIAVEWENKGESHQTIVDIGDFSIVPDEVEPEMRGPGAVSAYDRISKKTIQEAVRTFERHDQMVDELQEISGLDLSKPMKRGDFDIIQATLEVEFILPLLYFTKTLTFCTHGFSHECFRIHGQENGVWCVVATGQMLLDFWRFHETQTDIAAAMNTGPGGTGYADEVNGYHAIACSHFTATHDTSPTLAEARAEIDANRPFDYSYSYHAMACAGYRRLIFQRFLADPQYSLLIYDPSPVNIGTIRWETWGAGISAVDGFVYLRRT